MAALYSPDDFQVSEWIDAGHVDIDSRVDPPSLQANRATKNAYRETLASAIASNTSRFFTHDVEVRLDWFISEERRYQTHIVSDLDNILKPTIDALVGPDCILFDDNQVQSIKASWLSGTGRDGYQLRVDALMPDDTLPRGGKFVEVGPTRCFYVPEAPPQAQREFANHMAERFKMRAQAAAEGVPEELLRMIDPIARSFPRARLSRFEVLRPDQF